MIGANGLEIARNQRFVAATISLHIDRMAGKSLRRVGLRHVSSRDRASSPNSTVGGAEDSLRTRR